MTADRTPSAAQLHEPTTVELARLSMAYSDAVTSARMLLEGEGGRMLLGDLSGARVVGRHLDEPVWVALTEAIKAVLGDV